MRRAIAAVLLAAWSMASAADSGTHAPVPGTGVSLIVPEGFTLSDEFPGVGRDEDVTSVLVTQLSVPIGVSRESFDAEGLGAEGIRVQRIVKVQVDGREGWLAHASQRTAGLPFRKWLLLFGDDRQSVMITATTPLDLESTHQHALVETLSTARWRPEPADAGNGELPFRISEVPPLRIMRSTANAVVLADEASRPDRVAPLATVGVSLAQVQIRDLPGFARRRLEQSVSIEEIDVEDERGRELDGMPGHWIRGVARDIDSDREVAVSQLLATDGKRYYIVQGIVDLEDREAFAGVLEELVASFRLAR